MYIKIRKCRECIFYISNKKCSVYSNGIPEKIWDGEHDHTEPYEGDGGIQFEPIEE